MLFGLIAEKLSCQDRPKRYVLSTPRLLKSSEQKKCAIPGTNITCFNLTIVGAGYVGLVTAAAFASMGYETTCIDTDHEKLVLYKRGSVRCLNRS